MSKKTNILIVGGGKKGKALIELFYNRKMLDILAVVDDNNDAPGIKLAKELGIPTADDYKQFLNKNKRQLDEIIDATEDQQVRKELVKLAPSNVKVMGDHDTNLILDLIDQVREAREELGKIKDELEIQTWGLNKTNAGIKILYKELQKKNEELKKLDQLKSDFLSVVSHELRTPLTTIREVISQFLDGILGETTKKQSEFLSICLQDIDRLTRIISNLLDISKIEAGKVVMKRKLVDIVDLTKGLCSAFYHRAKGKGLEIRTAFSQEKTEVYADRDKIIQVFNNLVGNAFKFTEKGYIEISVIDKQGYVECSVSDTGKGIPQEIIDKIFEPFFTTREVGQGTGLGMSISYRIITDYGGTIEVESEVDEGTTFTLRFPAVG